MLRFPYNGVARVRVEHSPGVSGAAAPLVSLLSFSSWLLEPPPSNGGHPADALASIGVPMLITRSEMSNFFMLSLQSDERL
ncbi:hypothetical protein D9M69_608210 [compost metagenome]